MVAGKGFEAVVTLGTGVGTAFFVDGHLMPHLEFSHQVFRKGETFNEQLGEPARKQIGDKKLEQAGAKAIACFDALTFFDHLYIGGGNGPGSTATTSARILERITVVDNAAGILGGIKLWDESTSASDHPPTAHRQPTPGSTARRTPAMTSVDTEPLAWDPLNEKYKVDPHAIWKRLRDEATALLQRAVRLLCREPFAEVDAFSRDPKTFCSCTAP